MSTTYIRDGHQRVIGTICTGVDGKQTAYYERFHMLGIYDPNGSDARPPVPRAGRRQSVVGTDPARAGITRVPDFSGHKMSGSVVIMRLRLHREGSRTRYRRRIAGGARVRTVSASRSAGGHIR
ncbi:hypothetical protein BRCH_00735c [Candidatus Burkholderia brachyanthoides]|nr:hypothetical protein BRCH_00735c [Candidatus Burkholderia brachyanthoides]